MVAIVKKKKRIPFLLLLRTVNIALCLTGLYVVLGKFVMSLPFVQRHLAFLVWKGVHTHVAEWLSNWNLHWIIGG